MAKKENPTPPADPVALPATVPRVCYETIEGITTIINPQPAPAPAEPEESAE